MDAYFTANAATEPWLSTTDPAARKAFLKELHEMKTDIFNELIETGRLPVRPGVKRLIGAYSLLTSINFLFEERAFADYFFLILVVYNIHFSFFFYHN